jgi:hypothetical protein
LEQRLLVAGLPKKPQPLAHGAAPPVSCLAAILARRAVGRTI